MIIEAFFIITMILLVVILYKTNNISKNEYFKQCAKIISPTCNKKTIYSAISKLENDINKLDYIIKSRSLNKSKVNELYSWYKNKQEKELRFKKGAQRNVENQISQFAEETENRMAKDRKKGDKIHKKQFAREKRQLNKAYKPLKF